MTWNPSDKAATLALSNSNRTVTKSSGNSFAAVRSATGAADKRYAELLVVAGGSSQFITIGLANVTMPLSTAVGADANGWGYYQQTGEKYNNNVLAAFGASYTSGDIIGLAYDPVAGKVWFSKNNTWQASGDPAAGTNPAFSSLASGLFLAVALFRIDPPTHQITGRFVTADLSYSPPSGFTPWDDPTPGASRMLALF